MLFFPLPFLTAFFLIFVLIHLVLLGKRGLPYMVLVTLSCYPLQSVLIGINWGIVRLSPMLMVSAALTLPPLTWLSLSQLSHPIRKRTMWGILGLIVVLVAVVHIAVVFNFALLTDLVSVGVYAFFGTWLLWLAGKGNMEWIDDQPLHLIMPTQRAYFLSGAILLASAAVDIAVALDLTFNHGRISSALVGYGNFTLLAVLLFLFFSWSRHKNRRAVPALPRTERPLQRDIIDPLCKDILQKLECEMVESKLYRKENLTLRHLASKLGVPSRQVSIAINSLCGLSVPQYVNIFRVRDACQMLEETDITVTEIIFAVGFTTKSNFNREFLRITGFSPSAWRRRARGSGVGTKSAPVDLMGAAPQ